MKDLYLSFTLGKEDDTIGILHVIELLGIPRITGGVQNLPKHFKGLVYMRGGRIVPVLDLRLWFGMEEEWTQSALVSSLSE